MIDKTIKFRLNSNKFIRNLTEFFRKCILIAISNKKSESSNILTNFRSLKNGIAIASVYITTVQEIRKYLAERLFSHQTLVIWPLVGLQKS